MKRKITFFMAAFALLVFTMPSLVAWGQSTYTKVTTTPSDWTGTYVIVADASNVVFTGQSGTNTYGGYAEVTITDNQVTGDFTAYEVEIAQSGTNYSIKHTNSGKYLGWTSGNSLAFSTSAPTANSYRWVLSTSSILNANDNSRKLQYNSGSPRFACYTSSQKVAYLYKKEVSADEPSITASDVSIAYNATEGFIDYTINNPVNGGQLSAATDADWITNVTVDAQVHFTCYSNDGLERTATITLTYTYNTNQTVTKDVTVTQASAPNASGTENNPYTVAQALAAVDAGNGTQGVYAAGIVSAIPTAWNTQYNNITFNMVDEVGDEDFLQAFRCVSTTNANASEIAVGDIVVVYGDLILFTNSNTGATTYELNAGCQLISLTHPAGTVATPTFSPNGGTFTEAQTVTISCETPNVTIYYTTNGSDPDDESTQYSGPITVGESMTVKARAYDNNDNASAIASATFTINLPYTGDPYARVNDVSYLTDGAKVVFAARFDGNANQYYAMTATASGKPTGVLFTSATSNDLEVLPAAIVNSENNYCWTVGVTSNGYTFTNANGKVIGWSSSTNFVDDGNNTEWTVELGTSGENAMVPNYEAFNIVNIGTTSTNTTRAIALNNSHNFGPYAISNNNSADYNLSIDIFVQGAEPVVTPSITANNVAIEYSATSGSIAYSITNEPTPAGTMTAAIANGGTIANLSLGTIANGTVPFTCDANMSGASRTATVTLTYTYNRETVTRDVTITQAANPNYVMTIAEVRALSTGTTVTTQGIVTSCVGTTGYIQDATAAICVFGAELTVGDEIKVTGPLTNFNGLLEIGSNSTDATVDEVISQNNTVLPQLMTIAEVISSTNQGWYVRIEDATVSAIDGKNVTIAQGEDNVVVRFANTDDITFAVSDIISLDGNIGAYNGLQIANPQNVEVQQNTDPNVTIADAIVNVPAAGGNGIIDVTYANIPDEDIDPVVMFYTENGAEATYDWITITFNEDKNAVYSVDPNSGEARTAYFKVYEQSEGIYSNLVTVNQAQYVVDYATLPFEFDGGKADIETTNGLTQNGLSSDYSSSPKLKFDGTGDWVILKFNERPGILTFDIKGNGSGSDPWSGTFTVQTSVDGETYTDLATYTVLGTTQHETFNNLASDVRYIKWIYTNKNIGNVALGNIALTEYVAPQEYTLTVEPFENLEIVTFVNEVMAMETDGEIQVNNGDHIMLSIVADDGYIMETLMVNGVNHVNDITADFTYEFDMPAETVTITATAIEYVAPTPGNWVLTSLADLTEDDVFVIVGTTNNVSYAMPNVGECAQGAPCAIAVTVVEGTLSEEPDAELQWNLGITEDGYIFYPNGDTENWLYCTNSNNGVRVGDNVNNVFTMGNDGYLQHTSTGRYVGIYNAQDWRCYTNTTGNIANQTFAFYKKVDAATFTQTLELTAGWNWVSLYIEVEDPEEMILMLEDALGENGLTIKAMEDGFITYTEEDGWGATGDLEEMYNEQMYAIEVSEDCTVEIVGMPAITEEHVIDIYPGWNWIGFPCSQVVSIEDAFADFEAEDGDMIKNMDDFNSYDEGWGDGGDLEDLEPGQGYKFYSASDDDRELVFSTGAKAKRAFGKSGKPSVKVKVAVIPNATNMDQPTEE